jgi:cytochrome c553
MKELTSAIVALLALILWAPSASAYDTYSQGKVTYPDGSIVPEGNCATCHGQFRATDAENSKLYLQDEYKSLADGRPWREMYLDQPAEEGDEAELEVGLHDVHRHIMNDKMSRGSCNTCHYPGGEHSFYPVVLGDSDTNPLLGDPIGCAGCHGRDEDAGNDNVSVGLSAGLRQHHTVSGVTSCKTCHSDANPVNYTPVGENVQPNYYRATMEEFPNHPVDPCNWKRDEDYAGKRGGLDNDGDGRYDRRDKDCRPFNFFKRMGLTKPKK